MPHGRGHPLRRSAFAAASAARRTSRPRLQLLRRVTKAGLKKATWAASLRRVGWNFRAAFWANSECADHCRRVARRTPPLLLRKILPKVTPGPQQLNGAAHPENCPPNTPKDAKISQGNRFIGFQPGSRLCDALVLQFRVVAEVNEKPSSNLAAFR